MTTIFNSTEDLYNCIGQAFVRIPDNHFGPLHQGRMVIRFVCTNPNGQILLNGRENPVGIHFGEHGAKSNLTIWLATYTMHQIMLGELGIMKAMGQKKIKAKGSLLRVRALSPLFVEGQKIYPHILAEAGLM